MHWRTYERIESVWMWMTRRRLFEWIIGLLILDVLLLIGGYSPLHWLRMRLYQDYQHLRNRYTDVRKAYKEWTEARYRMASAREIRQELLTRTFLPEDTGFQILREHLQERMQAVGLQQRDIGYAYHTIETPPVTQLSIRLTVSGEYRQIRQFIHELEASPYFLILESIQLRSSQETHTVTLDLQLRTYLRKVVSPRPAPRAS